MRGHTILVGLLDRSRHHGCEGVDPEPFMKEFAGDDGDMPIALYHALRVFEGKRLVAYVRLVT